jgi:hypothetical protein
MSRKRFDERDGSGKFGVMIADRFAVGAQRKGVTLATLHDAVAAVDRPASRHWRRRDGRHPTTAPGRSADPARPSAGGWVYSGSAAFL